MASNYKQCSDHAQKGPGFKPVSAPTQKRAPSIAPTGNTKSGSSQSHTRGKQGW